ncbi:MAG: hypothetical protein ACXV3T_08520 [Halobacteriota archaeon]
MSSKEPFGSGQKEKREGRKRTKDTPPFTAAALVERLKRRRISLVNGYSAVYYLLRTCFAFR